MEKTITSVEWFFNELQRMQYFIGNDMLEAYKQAKEMEKQNIIITYIDGYNSDCMSHESTIVYANDYYNKKFKQE